MLSEAGANRGESRRYAGKMVFQLYQSHIFKKVLQPATPNFLKRLLRKMLLRKNQQPTIPPTRESLEKIVAGVSADVSKFETLLGFKEPLWNLEESIEHVLLQTKAE